MSKKTDTIKQDTVVLAVADALTKTNIFDASTKEIIDFAAAEAGLSFPSDAGRDYMIREIHEALGWEAYAPEDGMTHVIIKLPKTKENKGHPYQGGFNGKMFSVKRGTNVELTIGQYNTMLDSAIMRFTIENLDPSSSNISEGGNAHKRIPVGALELQVVSFINKGGKNSVESE
jgi:hypothetical protein